MWQDPLLSQVGLFPKQTWPRTLTGPVISQERVPPHTQQDTELIWYGTPTFTRRDISKQGHPHSLLCDTLYTYRTQRWCDKPLIYRESGREEEKGGGRESERDCKTSISCLVHEPQPRPGIVPATQVCALDWQSKAQPFGAQTNAITT